MAIIDVAGVPTYYEDHGEGEDVVVLLHGGMTDGRGWGAQLPALVADRRVVVPDRRGHGRTPDTDAPFDYGEMAVAMAALVDDVVGGPAHVVGWSDGAIVAMHLALARPELVRRLVLIGANFHHNGTPGASLGDDPESPEVAMLKASYESVAPDPSRWPIVLAKTNRLWTEQPTMTVDDVAAIDAPTLVLVGDDEPVLLSHTCALYEALPHGQLSVVPGTSHLVALEKPELVNRLLVDFLAETGPPTTFLPIRRA